MRAPIPGQQVGDPLGRMVGQSCEDIGEPGLRVARSPLSCFLPSCGRPFEGTCVHANDDHFYCSSNVCADEGDKIDLSHVEQFKRKA